MKSVCYALCVVFVLLLASYGAYGAYLTARAEYSDLLFLRQAHINAIVEQQKYDAAHKQQ